MKVKGAVRGLLRGLGNLLLGYVLGLVCKTYKLNISNKSKTDKLKDERKNFILGFWHGTMLIPWYLHRGEKVAALVSRSKDGELLANVLSKWDYNVIRGSSNVGGKEALDTMIKCAVDGSSVAITPDGPTGPPRKLKAGIVITAKKSGSPIVLAGVGNGKKWQLNSWDRFEIPKPFSKVKVVYSDPIYIDSELSYEETSKLIEECGEKLNDLQKDAERNC
jgi:lysophospholipid acyltransferase (LPLAT)-like uncharacterized protein